MKNKFSISLVLRAILATPLLLALLASGIAVSDASGTHFCQMACCVGVAPHEVGSCSHSSCEVDLQPQAPDEAEQLCGAPRLNSGKQNVASGLSQKELVLRTKTRKDPPPSIVASLRSPCSPDCQPEGTGYSGLKRPNDFATNADPGGPAQPNCSAGNKRSAQIVRELNQLINPALPRGPPTFS